MPETSSSAKIELKCDLCGHEAPIREFGKAQRAFSIAQGPSRQTLMTSGEQAVCLDILSCFKRAVVSHLPDIVEGLEELEAKRLKEAEIERDLNEQGLTAMQRTVKTIKGKSMKRLSGRPGARR
jgi:hypothetical protein